MAGTVVGYFTSEAQAETAVSALRTAGFPSSQIGIALSSMSGSTGYPDTAGYDATGNAETGTSSSAHAGHAAGAAVASAWDRFKNFFEGSDEKDGVNAAHSHEVTAGSGYEYEHDDVAHSLSGLAVPEDRSRYFTHRFGSQGQGAVVTVTASGREAEAESILEANGGDVGNNTADYDYTAPVAPTGQQKIQLLGEVLRVQKDRISRGEVRIRKEVITEQQTIQVPVTREELVIERIPVSGTTAAAGRDRQRVRNSHPVVRRACFVRQADGRARRGGDRQARG